MRHEQYARGPVIKCSAHQMDPSMTTCAPETAVLLPGTPTFPSETRDALHEIFDSGSAISQRGSNLSAGPGPQRKRSRQATQQRSQGGRGFGQKRHEHLSAPAENTFTPSDPSAPPESQVRRACASSRNPPRRTSVVVHPACCYACRSTFLNLMKTKKISCIPALIHTHLLLMLRSYGSCQQTRGAAGQLICTRAGQQPHLNNHEPVEHSPAPSTYRTTTSQRRRWARARTCTWSCFRYGVCAGGPPTTSTQS